MADSGATHFNAVLSGNLLTVQAFLQADPDALNKVCSLLPFLSLFPLPLFCFVEEPSPPPFSVVWIRRRRGLTIMGMLLGSKRLIHQLLSFLLMSASLSLEWELGKKRGGRGEGEGAELTFMGDAFRE
jgi:hypothetical protein